MNENVRPRPGAIPASHTDGDIKLTVSCVDAQPYQTALRTLITANHILHYHHVLDAYGHISFRHPNNAEVFVMSGDRAPALVSSAADLIEYRVLNNMPIDANAGKGFSERWIHCEIYKRYPQVNSVVHSHSEAVIPYTMNGVPMRPTFHIAGFLGISTLLCDQCASFQAH
jgi:ribulose-5-phosphate 4-epimerase/fuculose-1-phosphate aldolase